MCRSVVCVCCCSVLQCAAVCYNECGSGVAVCCSVLQRIKILELFLTGVCAGGVYACVRVCALVVLQCVVWVWWCCCGVLRCVAAN